jgi:hypothetical protein
VKLDNLIIPAGQGIIPAGYKDFELAICEWPSRDGEKPAPGGDGNGEIGMGVSGRGGDRLQRRHIGSVQDDPESVQPLEVERIGDDRADDGGGDRYRRTELAIALAGPPGKRDGTGRAPARAGSGLDYQHNSQGQPNPHGRVPASQAISRRDGTRCSCRSRPRVRIPLGRPLCARRAAVPE